MKEEKANKKKKIANKVKSSERDPILDFIKNSKPKKINFTTINKMRKNFIKAAEKEEEEKKKYGFTTLSY